MVNQKRSEAGDVLDFVRRLELITLTLTRCLDEIDRLDEEIARRAGETSPELDDLKARREKAQELLFRVAEAKAESEDKMTALRMRAGLKYATETRRERQPRWVFVAWGMMVGLVILVLMLWGR